MRTLAYLVAVWYFSVLYGCSSGDDLTTRTESSQFTDPQEKLAFLMQYVRRTPGLLDAEYAIWYQDNGKGAVPGPSDYDIRLVAKVKSDSLGAWSEGMTEIVHDGHLSGWNDLMPDSVEWPHGSHAKVFRGQGKVIVSFPDQGLVMARYATAPIELK
ncbi:MAG: hypothetical protein JNL05_07665 [Flavobacteriales bacterium]|nr:hypothetical protein [Flavobacteriales bacterium]